MQLVPEAVNPINAPYEEWGRLTRFLESARLAFAHERDLWMSIGVGASTRIAPSGGHYRVTVAKHLEAIGDEEMLHASVLVHSYALAESAAADRLAMDLRTLRGIEDWGARLLASNKRDWSAVNGGLAGAVEVAVVRNAFVHGSRGIDEPANTRLLKAGARTRVVGSKVALTYEELREYRSRLLSLLNTAGI